jgi:hypothetical protein
MLAVGSICLNSSNTFSIACLVNSSSFAPSPELKSRMSELFWATLSVQELISSFERKRRTGMIGFRSPRDGGDSSRAIMGFFFS